MAPPSSPRETRPTLLDSASIVFGIRWQAEVDRAEVEIVMSIARRYPPPSRRKTHRTSPPAAVPAATSPQERSCRLRGWTFRHPLTERYHFTSKPVVGLSQISNIRRHRLQLSEGFGHLAA